MLLIATTDIAKPTNRPNVLSWDIGLEIGIQLRLVELSTMQYGGQNEQNNAECCEKKTYLFMQFEKNQNFPSTPVWFGQK